MKRSIKVIEIFVSLCVVCLITSCSKVEKLPLMFDHPNPTEYKYNVPMDELRDAIIEDFESPICPNIEEILCRRINVIKQTDNWSFSKSIYDKSENINDLILDAGSSGGPATLGYSNVYFKGDRPLLYVATFHLHFEKVSETSTNIKVFTINPKVVVGEQVFYIPSHRGYRYQEVTPTTIEEYKILLRIGRLVGEKKMPGLNLPFPKYNVPWF